MKSGRQEAIIKIVSENEVETQNQLLEELKQIGISTTQATLSRDIKTLHLTKRINRNNKYVYSVSEKNDDAASLDRLLNIFRECVVSFDVAQNILVIKTLPGLASAACAAFDSMEVDKLVGTIAGDDTAFMLFKDSVYAESFLHKLNALL